MSVIIKGMKMPDNCYECGGCEFDYSGDYSQAEAYCCLHKDMLTIVRSWQDHEMLDTIKKEKPDWCPLVEVPKGARLIDARDVKKHMIPLDFSVQNWISEVDLDIKVKTIFEGDDE